MNDRSGPPGGGKRRTTLTICNEKGLHARAAAKFVKCVERFEADVRVARHGMAVSGRSIMGLMMLAAAAGCSIEVEASGRQADEALAALRELVGNGFDEGS